MHRARRRELLITVHAASVNAIDWKIRAGYLKDVFPVPLPFIPGWDVSGIVEALGSGVTKFKKGDEVYARPDVARNGKGTYAEYVVVKETEAALKPKSVDHVHAAAIPVVGLTAWQAPFRQGWAGQGSKDSDSRRSGRRRQLRRTTRKMEGSARHRHIIWTEPGISAGIGSG
jgi:NADPH:quinone reductase-like Zn-dependent oxidoreductase